MRYNTDSFDDLVLNVRRNRSPTLTDAIRDEIRWTKQARSEAKGDSEVTLEDLFVVLSTVSKLHKCDTGNYDGYEYVKAARRVYNFLEKYFEGE